MGREVNRVVLTDVTLREYGQNLSSHALSLFTPYLRAGIARRLILAGFRSIEVFSCVAPRVAPAMEEEALKKLVQELGRPQGVGLIALVPNKRGYQRFLEMDLGADGYHYVLGLFFSAVEPHNRANLGKSIREACDEYRLIIRDAAARKIRIVGCISAAFGYRDPGKKIVIHPSSQDLNRFIDFYLDLGVERVTLSDLQGVGDHRSTTMILEKVFEERKGRDLDKMGYHPHHANPATAIENSKAAYELGIRHFDASLCGIGGCITGAPGNQPTETLVDYFDQLGIETGIDPKEIRFLAEEAERDVFSKISAK